MDSKQAFTRFEELSQDYITTIKRYSYEDLLFKPSPTSWSLGELNNHVVGTGFIQMETLMNCRTAAALPKKKSWSGRIVYFIGSIPPIKVKMPETIEHTPFQPCSKEQLLERWHSFLNTMRELETLVSTIPRDQKMKQPYLGYLNAEEWYEHIVMHVAHHLRQQTRIERVLRKRIQDHN
ncbi:DinB family protein [Paenibacillus sp. ACRRX]|uniref:DinB family protein n=1 Tax=Paenibacillus sp. ACRRX TaxID=2918206 RepID=UPI001EF3F5E7|nr:DinB family protein [Paenibacillus sp. ACRRX]MCG7407210.1 DinB family protein [Paenibacillus sp. ACRRX]